MKNEKRKHLLSILDLSRAEIEKIFELAAAVKRSPERFSTRLQGRMFGLIFEKPSTRTWVSFQTGIFSLGGGVTYLGPEDIKLGVREEVRDIARVLNRYLGGVILRTFEHDTIKEFEKYFDKPVINGLSNFEHPCQALADYMTIREKFGPKARPLVTYIGDGNNVFNSLVLLAAKLGGRFQYATPERYAPDPEVMKKALALAQKTGAVIKGFMEPDKAVRGADVVYTDVWISMGEEKMRTQKIKEFHGMQLNEELMSKAKKHALVMHCLPAHRGEEITEDVMESKNSVVFDQAENRLHAQKAVLLHLCGFGI